MSGSGFSAGWRQRRWRRVATIVVVVVAACALSFHLSSAGHWSRSSSGYDGDHGSPASLSTISRRLSGVVAILLDVSGSLSDSQDESIGDDALRLCSIRIYTFRTFVRGLRGVLPSGMFPSPLSAVVAAHCVPLVEWAFSTGVALTPFPLDSTRRGRLLVSLQLQVLVPWAAERPAAEHTGVVVVLVRNLIR